MPFDLLKRRESHFVFWGPGNVGVPILVLGSFSPGSPPAFTQLRSVPLLQAPQTGLWELPCVALGLPDGVYHYWYQVDASCPAGAGSLVITDPMAYTVDYRCLPPSGYQPAAVIKLDQGRLVPCDPGGEIADIGPVPPLGSLPPNNHLVIYELPPSWSRAGIEGGSPHERDVGTFRDVIALLDQAVHGANFGHVPEVSSEAVLVQLGINALELLPPADTKSKREWGYATAHYFAPDYDLGFPSGHVSPTAASDLAELVRRCHTLGIRLIVDMVMAFGHDPYIQCCYPEFHLRPREEPHNPDSFQSCREGEFRDGFGGESWRYLKAVTTYDPDTGATRSICPARQFHLAHLERWMQDFQVDGIRLDSVNNIGSWDFLGTFSWEARAHFAARYSSSPAGDREARFLVVAEELSVPLGLISENRVDALWNEHFQSRLRAAIIGESCGDNFEWTVRKMVDCRLLGFGDGAQAVNYITSHDTEGYRKERLYDFLESCGVYEKEQRARLAFVCLLTSVGVPMIFAGEEFCDQQDLPAIHPSKQIDPVNYARKRDPWRSRLFEYVSRLIDLRKRSPALGVNDTRFIHFDFEHGRRIAAWVRGIPGVHDPVVVVANFSGSATPGLEYLIPNWPETPAGKRWREVTQVRDVPVYWAGREPLFPWEAKVYEMV